MRRVTRRVYERDHEGHKVLLYAPGDLVSETEAKRLEGFTEPEESGESPWTPLVRLPDPVGPPPKPIERLSVGELIDYAEGAAGATMRPEYVLVAVLASQAKPK